MNPAIKQTNQRRAFLLFFLLFAFLAACRGDEAEQEQAPVIQTQLVALDIGMENGRPRIDPQKVRSKPSRDLAENLFVGLTNYNYSADRVEPELAYSWEASPDGRLWTFHLRDDMFWVLPTPRVEDNGLTAVERIRPVTAADVVFAVQRSCTRSVNSPDAFILFIISGCRQAYEQSAPTPETLAAIAVEAVDDVTLQIELTEAAGSHFLTMTSMPYFQPVPPEALEEFGDDPGIENRDPTWTTVAETMYSGPFLITPASDETRTVLHRNTAWPLPRLRGNVDVVNIIHPDDEEATYQLWNAKMLDLSPLPANWRETVLEQSPTKALLVPEQTLFYLGYNVDAPALQELAVRQALNAAIDRERLVEELYNGRAVSMKHLTPPNTVGSLPVDETGVGYSPDYARQRMADSSFHACRLMPPMTILVSASDLSLQLVELIRDMWIEELGCSKEQIVIEQASFGELLANTQRDAGEVRPDMWELGWTTYYPDAHNWLGDLLHCTNSENRQNRPCDATDELIDRAVQTMDVGERRGLYRQIENAFFNEGGSYPLSPLYLPAEYLLAQSWLEEYMPPLFGGEQYDTITINADLKALERSRAREGN